MRDAIECLLSEFKLNNSLTLKNRILMAPMTRAKADKTVPTQAMAEYYARRAAAGLIITEATVISPTAHGFNNATGVYSDAQIAGWKKVTEAVHANGGLIFLQLWHVGRVSHPDLLNGQLPISASATTMTGKLNRSELMFGTSRAASVDEIKELVQSYVIAAKNAMQAGFDGIEIHGANGYLIDQFLHYSTNLRSDEYGGSPQNMTRFALEIVKACVDAVGNQRVALRLTPGTHLNQIVGDMRDSAVFAYLLEQLNQYDLAYVHTGTFNDALRYPELNDKTMTGFMREHYRGTLVAAGGYHFENAAEGIKEKKFDLVAIGRPFIANPDLMDSLRNGLPLKPYDSSMLETLY